METNHGKKTTGKAMDGQEAWLHLSPGQMAQR